ncbi:uncharacterized protein N7483_010876 [Penicillium malachiteum]|uniref:uncharacterized protein n=1 Tax=Penicillium malachiteum TaxID=1324776 RepID=UPI00254843F9|nr:uncharacterized protein N7483_010876 [Penicillium malachiteum]KAJ5713695.1 hypothetical protein N7483_010876 [Penicillium malachiteum]
MLADATLALSFPTWPVRSTVHDYPHPPATYAATKSPDYYTPSSRLPWLWKGFPMHMRSCLQQIYVQVVIYTTSPPCKRNTPHCFPIERLLRIILTFLPESTEPSEYVGVLQELNGTAGAVSQDREIDTSAVKYISEEEARRRVRKLRLRPLKQDGEDEEEKKLSDPLTLFLIHRANLIDTETSLQPLILNLVLPFYEQQPFIRTWLISSLLPALRLNYEYYPNREEIISLDTLELMDDRTAVNVLLSMSDPEKDNMDLVTNLRGLIGPWLYGSSRAKRRRLNEAAEQTSISFFEGQSKPKAADLVGWEHVNEWLLSRSMVDYNSVVNAFVNWAGPGDVDLGGYGDKEGHSSRSSSESAKQLLDRYGQSGLSVVYAQPDSSHTLLEGSFKILSRVAELLGLEECSYLSSNDILPSVDFDTELISSSSRASLLQNALMSRRNPLTIPSPSSISFASALLLSLRVLTGLGHIISCRVAANICLHSTQEIQLAELQSVVASMVKQPKSYQDWQKVRQDLLWLRDWQAEKSDNGWEEPSTHHGLFWQISRDAVETEILKALLGAKEYQLAVDLYTQSESAPLSRTQVEAAVVEAIFTAYDNASNGNRTRGGMKRAFDILQAFQPHFPDSTPLKEIRALIAATHALSFYALTLQHGVPFQPVSIRVHHDPISLVEKVLDQNLKGYTKLDDLISIGHNLVSAGLPTTIDPSSTESNDESQVSNNDALLTAERRITSLAISSALTSNDFGTAYSYILTRLAPKSNSSSTSQLLTNPPSTPDDISWRAVMELLSLALVLAPTPDPLPEILGAWRRCDEELSSLRAREQSEEDAWDAKADHLSTVPGGFGPSDSERDAFDTAQQRAARRARARAAMPHSHGHEAPMGLFEVARGAAMALHKNAFPLRGAASGVSSASANVSASARQGESEEYEQGEGRVRKRDMVSNMVTGGLASGIGWVLGAEPVNR